MLAFEVAHHGQIFSSWGGDSDASGSAFHLLVLTVQLVVAGGIVVWACRTFWGLVRRPFHGRASEPECRE